MKPGLPLLPLLALFGTGCSLFGGVRVEALDVSAEKPSNVAFYVSVSEKGEPVTDLEPKDFKIYEDGQLLSPRQIGRTLLAPDAVTDERTILLVDLSGNPGPDQRALYVQAAEAFVRKLVSSMSVSVRAYAGGERLLSVADFPRGTTRVAAPALKTLQSGDTSRNLHGAIKAGLEALDLRSDSGGKPIKLGTLVVFARGPDLAGRVPGDAIRDALSETRHTVLGIVIGPDASQLDFLPGDVTHAEGDALPIAFEEAGSRVAKRAQAHYLVAYCSPARAGTRTVRLEVAYTNAEGSELSGDTYYELDASDFRSGCDASRLPRFEKPQEKQPKASQPSEGAGGSTDAEPAVVAPPASGDYAQ